MEEPKWVQLFERVVVCLERFADQGDKFVATMDRVTNISEKMMAEAMKPLSDTERPPQVGS